MYEKNRDGNVPPMSAFHLIAKQQEWYNAIVGFMPHVFFPYIKITGMVKYQSWIFFHNKMKGW